MKKKFGFKNKTLGERYYGSMNITSIYKFVKVIVYE